jgi:hypothetical protein
MFSPDSCSLVASAKNLQNGDHSLTLEDLREQESGSASLCSERNDLSLKIMNEMLNDSDSI